MSFNFIQLKLCHYESFHWHVCQKYFCFTSFHQIYFLNQHKTIQDRNLNIYFGIIFLLIGLGHFLVLNGKWRLWDGLGYFEKQWSPLHVCCYIYIHIYTYAYIQTMRNMICKSALVAKLVHKLHSLEQKIQSDCMSHKWVSIK